MGVPLMQAEFLGWYSVSAKGVNVAEREVVDRDFETLGELLVRQQLPTSMGRTRRAQLGEFMWMAERVVDGQARREVAFKHIYSHNYVFVVKVGDGEPVLVVPKERDILFMKGTFERGGILG